MFLGRRPIAFPLALSLIPFGHCFWMRTHLDMLKSIGIDKSQHASQKLAYWLLSTC